jgi:cyclopropane fatty-acyl-phospholipid synthase-like methyltransferase
MNSDTTSSSQSPSSAELYDADERIQLGLFASQNWAKDPRRLMFKMSRYKFVSKMLTGKDRVLEIGCRDAFPARLVQQEVGSLCAIELDPVLVKDVNDRMDDEWQFECKVHDIQAGPVEGPFDAAYSLDVIEHIAPEDERDYMLHVAQSLTKHGVLILGSPSVQSQPYASANRKGVLVNAKTQPELQSLMQDYFHNVFLFSMNDEVMHTGYAPMSHYYFALGVGNKVAI